MDANVRAKILKLTGFYGQPVKQSEFLSVHQRLTIPLWCAEHIVAKVLWFVHSKGNPAATFQREEAFSWKPFQTAVLVWYLSNHTVMNFNL